MAQPLTIPSNSMIFPVNLSSSFKTITLPVVSTNPGRFIIFKDVYGNAATSSLRLSTTGVDTIERSNANSLVLSNSYGAWWFTNDGRNRWFLVDAYFNNTFIMPRAVFFFTSFSATNFTTAGTATFVGSEARITSNTTLSAGSMYYNQKVNIQTFNTTFVMRFEITQADGGTFIIQNASSNALGSTGGGLGYSGIGTSVALTFDTWNGSAGQLSMGVLSNGQSPPGQGASGVLNTILGITDNTTWNLRTTVSYNGTTLSWVVTNTANGSNFSSNATVNIPSIVGANTAWVGFTGGTGGATERQFISSWEYAN